MTTRSIKDQVQTIKAARATASSSKEAAIAFLRDAGIIGNTPAPVGKVKESGVAVVAKGWSVVDAKEGRISVFSQGSYAKTTAIRPEGHYVTRSGAVQSAKAVGGSAKAPAIKKSSKK